MTDQDTLPDDVEETEHIMEETIDFIFKEYDPDGDGKMERKEFFAFLWKLRSDPASQLNEGQMISCWEAVDPDQTGVVTLQQFKEGLEKIYDNQFFARENGGKIVEPQIVVPVDLVAPPSDEVYNTVRFQKSAGVALFNQLLEAEKNDKQTKKEVVNASRPPPLERSYEPRSTRSADKNNATVSGTDGPPKLSSYTRQSSSGDLGRTNSILVRSTNAVIAAHQKEKEQKKVEAQKNLERIMSEKHKEEKMRREAERQKRMEEERKKSVQEAEELMEEPAWKKNLKTNAKRFE